MQSMQTVATRVRDTLEFKIFGDQVGGMSLKNLIKHFRPHRVLIEKEFVGHGPIVIILDRLPQEEDVAFCKRIMAAFERMAVVKFMRMERS